MKTQGEIEAAISDRIARFEQEYVGRGPQDIHAHLLGDLIVVRLRGVLTVAEQQLARAATPDKGRDLVKRMRAQIIEVARPVLEAIVEEVCGTRAVSLLHDISTTTDEEVIVLSLAGPAAYREHKRK